MISNHEDANKDHVCDYCGKVISNHEDADDDHVCDICGKVITNHAGGKETCRDTVPQAVSSGSKNSTERLPTLRRRTLSSPVCTAKDYSMPPITRHSPMRLKAE